MTIKLITSLPIYLLSNLIKFYGNNFTLKIHSLRIRQRTLHINSILLKREIGFILTRYDVPLI